MFFWSGKSFDEPQLEHSKGTFQDAFILYTDVMQIDTLDMARWILKARDIQWDYKKNCKEKRIISQAKVRFLTHTHTHLVKSAILKTLSHDQHIIRHVLFHWSICQIKINSKHHR